MSYLFNRSNRSNMYKKIISSALLVLGVLSSCSNDASEIQTPGTTKANIGEKTTIALSLSGSYIADASRAVSFGVNADGSSELQYPDSLTVHCAIKSTNTALSPTYLDLVWHKDSANVYSFKSTNVTVNTHFTEADDWYIAGVIGGTFNASAGTVTFDNSTLASVTGKDAAATTFGSANLATLDVPFAFGWTKLSVRESIGYAENKSIVFKPQGSLLKLNIENSMLIPYRVRSLIVESNAMAFSGDFDLSATPTAGTLPTWSSNATGSRTYTFAARPTIAAETQSDQYYLFWTMPITASDPVTKVYANITGISNNAEVAATAVSNYQIFYSTDQPANGKTYNIRTLIKRPVMFLETVAEYNLASAGIFATSHAFLNADGTPTDALYLDLQDAFITNASSTAPDTYHLPNVNEAYSLFPNYTFSQSSATAEESVWLPDLKMKIAAKAAYKKGTVNGNTVLYGIRYQFSFSGGANGGRLNFYASAWRFENVTLDGVTPVQNVLKVTQRYLGSLSSTTIDDIADEAFWTTVPRADYQVERIFPRAGYKYNGTYYKVNERGLVANNETSVTGALSFHDAVISGNRTNNEHALKTTLSTNPTLVKNTAYLAANPTYTWSTELVGYLSLPVRVFKDYDTHFSNQRFKAKN